MLDWHDCRPKLGADIEGSIMNTLCKPELILGYEVDKVEHPDAQFKMKKFEEFAGLNLKSE